MPSLFRHRFRWHGDRVLVDLPGEEEEMLRHVLPQLRKLLIDDTDPALRRLRPTARPDDDEAEAAFRALVDDDLLRSRLEAIETVEAGIGGTSLDDEGVGAWMHSLNALRLVLGERLDITAIGQPATEVTPEGQSRQDDTDHGRPRDDGQAEHGRDESSTRDLDREHREEQSHRARGRGNLAGAGSMARV